MAADAKATPNAARAATEPQQVARSSTPPAALAPFDAAQASRHQEEWAKHLGIEVEGTNSIGQTFVLIPPGTFTMGQAGGDSDEKPHEVTLSRAYFLGATEVTNGQWERVMGSVPSNWKEVDRPVEQVSWEDAVAFCQKLSWLPEEREAGRVYRLPTEAEWEYACRAGTETQYSYGDDESRLGEYAWVFRNSRKQTWPVGLKKPNAWGLYDLHGNVWEWCSDWYGKYPNGPVTDPQGQLSDALSSGGVPRPGLVGNSVEASGRVFRGGGWDGSARYCRSALRDGGNPSIRGHGLGFRLALSPSGTSAPKTGK